MIVSLHVASGGLVGALAGTRGRAAYLGAFTHLVGDLVPHRDFPSRRFETASGTAAVLLLAATRGVFDPSVVGAVAAALPDVEHVVHLPRPGGRKLFPSHRIPGWHREGGMSAPAQLVVACAVLCALAGSGLVRARSGGRPRRAFRPRRRS